MIIKKCLAPVISFIAVFSFGHAQAQSKPGSAMKKAAMERNAQNERNAQKEREQKQNANNNSQANNPGSSSTPDDNLTNHGFLTKGTDYVKGELYPPGWNHFADGCVFVDKTGELVTPFYKAIIPGKGVTITLIDDQDFKTKYGVVDSLGHIIANPIYYHISGFPENEQFLLTELNLYGFHKYGLISKTGNVTVDPIYSGIFYGNANLFIVRSFPEGKYGLIDKMGKEIVTPIYSYISRTPAICTNCFECVRPSTIVGQPNKIPTGLIDSNGKIIILPNYDLIKQSEYKGFYVIINKNEKEEPSFGLVTDTGKIITEPKFESEATLYQFVKSKGVKLIRF